MADNTISVEALELSVKTSTGSAASSVKELVEALNQLKGKYRGLVTFANSVNTLKNATKGGLGLATAANQVEKFGTAVAHGITPSRIEKIRKLASAINYLKRASADFRMPSLSAINNIAKAKAVVEKQKTSNKPSGSTYSSSSNAPEPPDYKRDTTDGMVGATKEQREYAESFERICEANRKAASSAAEAKKEMDKSFKVEIPASAYTKPMSSFKAFLNDMKNATVEFGKWLKDKGFNFGIKYNNLRFGLDAAAGQFSKTMRSKIFGTPSTYEPKTMQELLGMSERDKLIFQRNSVEDQINAAMSGEKNVSASRLIELGDQYERLTAQIKRASRTNPTSLFGKIKSGASSAAGAVRNYIKEHTKMLQQFGRVAKMRAMRWAIRMITSSIKEGIGNLYQYSKLTGGSFASSMDSAATALLQMKNALATAIAPVIQALIPVLEKVTDYIIDACNWLSQFLALLNGETSWTKAKKSVVTYAEAESDATKNTKNNTKELLAAFDELNVIASETNGSGSGSKKEVKDYKDMFTTETTFDKGVRDLVDKIKSFFPGSGDGGSTLLDILKTLGKVWLALKAIKLTIKGLKFFKTVDEIYKWLKEKFPKKSTPDTSNTNNNSNNKTEQTQEPQKQTQQAKQTEKVETQNQQKITNSQTQARATDSGNNLRLTSGSASNGTLSLPSGSSASPILYLPSYNGNLFQNLTSGTATLNLPSGESVPRLLAPETTEAEATKGFVKNFVDKVKAFISDESGHTTFSLDNLRTGAQGAYNSVNQGLLNLSAVTDVTSMTNGMFYTDYIFNRTSLGRWVRNGINNAIGQFFGQEPQENTEDPAADAKELMNNLKQNGKTFAYDWETLFMAMGIMKDDGRLDGKTHYTDADSVSLPKMLYGEAEKARAKFLYNDSMKAELEKSKDTLKKFGLEAKDILDNIDLIAPVIDSVGTEESSKRIIKLVKKYGDNWLEHIDEIGADTLSTLKAQSRSYTMWGQKLHEALAKGIASDKSYKNALAETLKTTKTSIGEIKKIVNDTKLTAPIIETYGLENSIILIERIATVAGDDTRTILENWDLVAPAVNDLGLEKSLEVIIGLSKDTGLTVEEIINNWDLIAPHIDKDNISKSISDISTLIKKYGSNWKKHLNELDLKAEVNVQEKKNWWQSLKETIQGWLDSNPFIATIKNIWNGITGAITGSGADSSSSGNNGSSNATEFSNSATIAPDSSVAVNDHGNTAGQDAMKSWLYSTQADILMRLSQDHPDVFTKKIDKVVQSGLGKENSKKIEVFNLTKAEVAWLKKNGYTIPSGYEHYNYGKGIRQIRQLAKGGIGIPSGDLFLANETGVPEMIGRIGNRNAVVNNTQIVQGIAQGMASVMAGVERRLERIERYAGITAEKDFSVKITPSVGLGRVNAQSAALYSGVTGR